jgi:hypothetical protein
MQMDDSTRAVPAESPWQDLAFKRQVLATFLGALAAFIFGFAGIVYQARAQSEMQRKQFLLDRRVAALKDFVAAVNGDGNLFNQYDRLERQLAVAISHPDSEEASVGVVREGDELNAMFHRYVAGLRAQTAVVAVVFGLHLHPPMEIPDFPDLHPIDLTGESKKKLRNEILDAEKDAIRNVREWRKGMIKFVNSYYEIIDMLQSQIDVR